MVIFMVILRNILVALDSRDSPRNARRPSTLAACARCPAWLGGPAP